MADMKRDIARALMQAMGGAPSAIGGLGAAAGRAAKPPPRRGGMMEIPRRGGMRPVPNEAGKTISDADRARIQQILRQLANKNRSRMKLLGGSGKTMSDVDRQRAMDRAGMLQALEAGEMGMGMSDADLSRLRRQLGMMRGGAVRGYQNGGAVKPKRKSKKGCVIRGRGGKFKGLK